MIFTSVIFEKVETGPGQRDRWWPLIDRKDYGEGVCLFSHEQGRGIPVSEFPPDFADDVNRSVTQQIAAGSFGGGGDLERLKVTDATPIAIQRDSELPVYHLTFFIYVARCDMDGGPGGNCADHHWMIGQIVLSKAEAIKVTRMALAKQVAREHRLSFAEHARRKNEVLAAHQLDDNSVRKCLCKCCELGDEIRDRREALLRPHNLDEAAEWRMIAHCLYEFDEMVIEAFQSDDPVADMFVFKDTLTPPD
jgi:hypothetical protein